MVVFETEVVTASELLDHLAYEGVALVGAEGADDANGDPAAVCGMVQIDECGSAAEGVCNAI